MKILFITASRIGDAVLSTGLLSYMTQKWPDAKVTIACGPLAVSLFEGCPQVECIIPLVKQKNHGHWLKLWQDVVTTRWDVVVDLRNSAVSRLVMAGERYIYGKHIDKKLHKVQQNAAVMTRQDVPSPRLWFTEAQMSNARAIIPEGQRVIAVGPAANWVAKTWPVERFIEVLNWLTARGGAYEGARIAVFGAPGEEDVCYQVLKAVGGIDAIAKGQPAEAAAAISLCAFYIGNDSGLMHAAAACGVKTFGLFGPSYPHLYAPWGEHTAYARTPESFDALIDYAGYTPQSAPCLMESLTVDAVKDGLTRFLVV
jgi:lipopolysaccharide export system permease protein